MLNIHSQSWISIVIRRWLSIYSHLLFTRIVIWSEHGPNALHASKMKSFQSYNYMGWNTDIQHCYALRNRQVKIH